MERLKGTAAVICEFNPFHFGHAYLLARAKKKYHTVFGIMSGNLIQRGGNACADKYLRAAAAVDCGFDGVVELPFPYSGLSARDFARAGVHIAEEAGFEALVFAAEHPRSLARAAKAVLQEGFETRVQEYIKENKNISYPKAFEHILSITAGKNTATNVCKPNGILGLEYIKAASVRNLLKIEITARNLSLTSAGSLRGQGVPTGLLPPQAERFFNQTVADGALGGFCAAAAKLYDGDKAELYGIDRSLAGKITKACNEAGGYEDIISRCRSATDTDSRLRRAFISILFGVTKEKALQPPAYTLALAFNTTGGKLLKQIKKQSSLAVSEKPAGLVGNSQFDFALRAERVMRQIFNTPDPLNRIPYVKGEEK